MKKIVSIKKGVAKANNGKEGVGNSVGKVVSRRKSGSKVNFTTECR